MQIANEIRSSLKREYSLYSHAMAFYKKAIKSFETKYDLSTSAFLKKFEAGQLGDEADYFDWYSYAQLLDEWQRSRTAIHTAIR